MERRIVALGPSPADLIPVARVDELVDALHFIAAGGADALYVQRLGYAARSLPELVRLLDWLREAGAELIAADVALDTGTRAGRWATTLLREVEGWGREVEGWGREVGAPRRPPGRPGLAAHAPHVAERIAELRERGLSLAAIAATLNAEGVPTPRGGAQWRPSSVQAALGYRRPRPPVPGAPRPKPPNPPKPPKPLHP